MKKPVIVWFRQDLRLVDNPAFEAASTMRAPIVPVYVLDDANAGDFRQGAASRWWLHRSLTALNQDLDNVLLCLQGGALGVFWNRCYEALAHYPGQMHQIEIAQYRTSGTQFQRVAAVRATAHHDERRHTVQGLYALLSTRSHSAKHRLRAGAG